MALSLTVAEPQSDLCMHCGSLMSHHEPKPPWSILSLHLRVELSSLLSVAVTKPQLIFELLL